MSDTTELERNIADAVKTVLGFGDFDPEKIRLASLIITTLIYKRVLELGYVRPDEPTEALDKERR